MKKLLLLVGCLLTAQSLLAWGQKGHDVVAYIAECHLAPEAAERIEKVLDGRSPVYYANWMDNASHRPEYAHTKTWHYLNIDEGYTYETMPKNPDGDVLRAVETLVGKLSDGGLEPDEEATALKMLIHLVGDMHCPMHTGRLSDLGGNMLSVTFFGTPTDLHTVWDTQIVEAARRWSYSEWQDQIDRLSDDEIVFVQSGEPSDWMRETHEICRRIYAETPEGTEISYDYVDRFTPTIETQLLRGGYRLARLLNETYG